MIHIFLILAISCMPLFASPKSENSQTMEEFEAIFGSDLATDLEVAGLELDEAHEILKLVRLAQNQDVPVATDEIPRLPALDVELPSVWECFFETKSHHPLIVCPKDKNAASRFFQTAKENQTSIIAAIKRHGAVVFSGFDFILEEFPIVFEAATGVPPVDYEGDTPREKVAQHIYKSTAVAPAHHIGLHQEEAAFGINHMPRFLSFFCALPPHPGTGRTLAASAREITQSIKAEAPDLWELMNQELTTWAFYMPDTGFWTKVTKLLNPSHATVKEKFGTDDPELIQKWCEERGYKYLFVNGGVKVFHQPVPGVVELDGERIFCNQIHLSVRNAHLVGGWFNKMIADLLLYEQFGVQLSDATPISTDQADRLSRIIQPHEDGRDWKAGEIMIFDNVGALHGKTPHTGERKVYATMGGRDKKSAQ